MNEMINELSDIVEETCKKDTCRAGYDAWVYHIQPVIKYSKQLARKLNADEEIVEISAILHDYASVKSRETHDLHHIYGVEFAEELLMNYNYPKDKIEKIKHCIYSHRGSEDIPRETLEAQIVACADAMAHFDCINSLFRLCFIELKLSTYDATNYILSKLERSWNKLMPEAKDLIKDKYEAIKMVLDVK